MQQQWELFQNCKEKKKQQHFAAERPGAAADLCRTTGTTQPTGSHTNITRWYDYTDIKYYVYYVIIHTCLVGASSAFKRMYKSVICSYCSKMCCSKRQGQMSQLYISELEQYKFSHNGHITLVLEEVKLPVHHCKNTPLQVKALQSQTHLSKSTCQQQNIRYVGL